MPPTWNLGNGEVTQQLLLDTAIAGIQKVSSQSMQADIEFVVRLYRNTSKGLWSTLPPNGTPLIRGGMVLDTWLSLALAQLLNAYTGSTKQAKIVQAWNSLDKAPVYLADLDARRYQDVKFRPGIAAGDSAGNAEHCTDYDFTDEDVTGMAEGLWFADRSKLSTYVDHGVSKVGESEIPRMAWDGPARSFPKVGDSPMLDPTTGKQVTLEDGGVVYRGSGPADSPYVVGGYEFPRYNPKNWMQEQVNEMVFLMLLSVLCDAELKGQGVPGKTGQPYVFEFMDVFAKRKALLRDQWVTRVSGFGQRGGSGGTALNGRFIYQLFRYQFQFDLNGMAPFYHCYLPESVPEGWLLKYKDGGSWRYHGGGKLEGYNSRPGGVVTTAEDSGCVARAAVMTVGTYLSTTFNALVGLASLGTVNVDAIVSMAMKIVGMIIQAAAGLQVQANFKEFDLIGVSALAESWTKTARQMAVSLAPCQAQGEYYACRDASKYGINFISYWKSCADSTLRSYGMDPDTLIKLKVVATSVQAQLDAGVVDPVADAMAAAAASQAAAAAAAVVSTTQSGALPKTSVPPPSLTQLPRPSIGPALPADNRMVHTDLFSPTVVVPPRATSTVPASAPAPSAGRTVAGAAAGAGAGALVAGIPGAAVGALIGWFLGRSAK